MCAMSGKSQPFTAADLERPASEGRLLHDLCSAFLCECCDINGPCDRTKHNLTRDHIVQAFSFAKLKEDAVVVQLLEDLQVTTLESVWPGYNDHPPLTKEGMVWNSAQDTLLSPSKTPKKITKKSRKKNIKH